LFQHLLLDSAGALNPKGAWKETRKDKREKTERLQQLSCVFSNVYVLTSPHGVGGGSTSNIRT
jgi:hypothetical protein